MTLFYRYISCIEYAANDLERGYSFSDYVLLESPDEVAEHFWLSNYEVADYGDNPGYYSGRDVTAIAPLDEDGTQWGVMLNGLCGFEAASDELSEAVSEAISRGGYNGMPWPFVAIFEGCRREDWRVYDGDVFSPTALLGVWNIETGEKEE